MNKKVLYLVHGAVIAALYVVLTMLANALGLANYAIQVRFSEALTILPVFTPAGSSASHHRQHHHRSFRAGLCVSFRGWHSLFHADCGYR